MPIQIQLLACSWLCVPLVMATLFIPVSPGAGLLAGQKSHASSSACHGIQLWSGSPLHGVPRSESAQAGQVYVTT